MTKYIALLINRTAPRWTNSGYILGAAASRFGATITRRQKGFSDWDLFSNLRRANWIEPRATGPRGGKTWHATAQGRYHLKKARAAMNQEHCPSCNEPNRLTPADKRLGYQCDNCADIDEGFANHSSLYGAVDV